jgi:hypothetical protein
MPARGRAVLDEVRVNGVARVADSVYGDADGERLTASVAPQPGHQGEARDTKEPGSRVLSIGRDVIETPPQDEEDLGGNVLGVARMDAPLDETQDGRIRLGEGVGEPPLACGPPGLVVAHVSLMSSPAASVSP